MEEALSRYGNTLRVLAGALTGLVLAAATGLPLAAATSPPPAAAAVTAVAGETARDGAADRRAAAASRAADTRTDQAVAVTSPPAGRGEQTAARRAGRHRTATAATVTAVPVARVAVAGAGTVALRWAYAQIGKPYVYGAAGPRAYDCSGLSMAAYRAAGVRLPHSTGGQLAAGRPVTRARLQPGDLVFLSSSHVGLYAGDGRMVVAPKTGDRVKVETVYAFYTARRIT